MLGCNESNIIFQQHLCKLGQLWRSNGYIEIHKYSVKQFYHVRMTKNFVQRCQSIYVYNLWLHCTYRVNCTFQSLVHCKVETNIGSNPTEGGENPSVETPAPNSALFPEDRPERMSCIPEYIITTATSSLIHESRVCLLTCISSPLPLPELRVVCGLDPEGTWRLPR